MGVIARQSIKGALANYLGVAIGFFTTFFVLTRYLTQEEVGLTRVMVDAALLFSSLAQLGSNSAVVKFFPYFKDGKSNHGIFGWSFLLPLVGFVLFGLVFLLFHDSLVGLYADRSPLVADYFYLLPMLTFFALYTAVFETNASVLMRITVPKLVREVGIRLFNLAAYLLYGYHVISLNVFVWLFCGSYGLAMILNLLYLLRLGRMSFRIDKHFLDRGKASEILRYSLYMTVTALAGNITLINSLFIGAKAGLALTGIYTIGSYIANVVEVPYRSLGSISRPVIAVAVKENNWAEVNRLGRQVSLHQLMVSLLIFYVIWINLDTLFAVIPNGADYAGGAGVVFVLGMAKIVNSSLSISTDILNFSRFYSRGLPFILTLTAAAVFLNSPFIDRWGIVGAAAATLTAYGIYFLLLLSYLWWKLKVGLFSVAQLKMLLIMGVLMLLDAVWGHWLTPLFGHALLLGAGVKTLVLGGLAAGGVLAWRVSPTVNEMVLKRLKT